MSPTRDHAPKRPFLCRLRRIECRGQQTNSKALLVLCFGVDLATCGQGVQNPVANPPAFPVSLQLLTGGGVHGSLVDSDDNGIVILSQETPHVVAYAEMDLGSAYRIKKLVLAEGRGVRASLSAHDHFELGRYVLERGDLPLALQEFALARKADASFADLVKALLDAHRAQRDDGGARAIPDRAGESGTPPESQLTSDGEIRSPATLPPVEPLFPKDHFSAASQTTEEKERLSAAYRAYYAPRWETLFAAPPIVEQSAHFVLFTDLDPVRRAALLQAAERFHVVLANAFGFAAERDVFLGRCPIFALRSKARFVQFARAFDQYEEFTALGYARSIESKGYVHVALYAPGPTDADFDQMVQTLVHEGAHAFLHRVPPHQLIPHWVNEGLAEWVTEEVLRERSPAGEKARLIGQTYVRQGWPITNLLSGRGPILAHQYSISHSVIRHLLDKSRPSFGRFLQELKHGSSNESACLEAYGLSLVEVEASWRNATLDQE